MSRVVAVAANALVERPRWKLLELNIPHNSPLFLLLHPFSSAVRALTVGALTRVKLQRVKIWWTAEKTQPSPVTLAGEKLWAFPGTEGPGTVRTASGHAMSPALLVGGWD